MAAPPHSVTATRPWLAVTSGSSSERTTHAVQSRLDGGQVDTRREFQGTDS